MLFGNRMLGEASRANITLRHLLRFALVQNAELSCNCETELRGEANARLASLGERSYALAKLYSCFSFLLTDELIIVSSCFCSALYSGSFEQSLWNSQGTEWQC